MSEGFAPSRRSLVMGGAVLAATLPATASTALARPFPHQDAADWQKQVGMNFAVAGEAGSAPMELIAVKAVRKTYASGAARAHSFTTVFEMDAAKAPKGGESYMVRHPELGVTSLYLDRTTEKGGKARLRATFN
jgi:hypothetical protein